ncbi:MAG: LysR family transcriptional regulator [Succinivibrio sp.]|nr:LysR family transcriptional regulator [Succinivibrio sp.]
MVDLNILKGFVMVVKLGTMTRAAQAMCVTQSALSKQMKALEEEFGCKLLSRSGPGVMPTVSGQILYERAGYMLSLYDKTKEDLTEGELWSGDIRVGAPETCHFDIFVRLLGRFREDYPQVRCHITSGMTELINERLDKGILDLALISGQPDLKRYNCLQYPACDVWGVLMRRDHVLALKKQITCRDLMGYKLMLSPQGLTEELGRWCGDKLDKLCISDTVNLIYNGTIMVREGVCLGLAYQGLADTSEDSALTWRPLYPRLATPLYLIWGRQSFTPVVERFLNFLKEKLPTLPVDSEQS